jgi:hypothetical protein
MSVKVSRKEPKVKPPIKDVVIDPNETLVGDSWNELQIRARDKESLYFHINSTHSKRTVESFVMPIADIPDFIEALKEMAENASNV